MSQIRRELLSYGEKSQDDFECPVTLFPWDCEFVGAVLRRGVTIPLIWPAYIRGLVGEISRIQKNIEISQ